MSKDERSRDLENREPQSPHNDRDEHRRTRPYEKLPLDSHLEFDEKIASLVASFEDRIARFKEHIEHLEKTISELRSAKDRARSTFDEFLNVQELTDMIPTQSIISPICMKK